MVNRKRSGRLLPVVKLAEDKEQEAARKLGESRQHLWQQQKQLDELESYRLEYISRLQGTARKGIKAARLRQYQGFVNKLSEAVDQQKKVVSVAERNMRTAQDNWFQDRNRKKMVDAVLSNCHAEELQSEMRSEQKESDERAQNGSGKR